FTRGFTWSETCSETEPDANVTTCPVPPGVAGTLSVPLAAPVASVVTGSSTMTDPLSRRQVIETALLGGKLAISNVTVPLTVATDGSTVTAGTTIVSAFVC